jgi:two-component sensor histidine kinase
MRCKLHHFILKLFASKPGILFLVSLSTASAHGQSNLTGYNDVARQRLLIRITAHYIHTISQGQIDMDSAVRIPCKLYGLSPLLVYNEGYSDGKPTAGTLLLDAEKVEEARALLTKLHDEARLRLLLDLGNYFVFKPGNAKADLNEASKYINEAEVQSDSASNQWKIESLMLKAYLFDQSGLTNESQKIFAKIMVLCEQSGNYQALARAFLNAGRSLHYLDPSRLPDFKKALSIFRSEHAKEKEIETLSEINVEHFILKHYDTAEQLVHNIVKLQTEINYQHQQYAYDVLAYLAFRKGEITNALTYSGKSLESMTSRADSTFAGLFFTRRGTLYASLKKFDESLMWFDKALENKSAGTRLYWYKAFLSKAKVLSRTGKEKEALHLLGEMGRQFPPYTPFEKMFFSLSLGQAYEENKNSVLAESSYEAFLRIAEKFPTEYVHEEFPDAYLDISAFYLGIGQTDKAKKVLDRIDPLTFRLAGKGFYYYHKYLIDSAEQKYLTAIQNLKLSQKFADSSFSYDQQKKATELLVKYDAEKKDKDIQLLNNQNQLQRIRVKEADRTNNITLAGVALLLIIIGLLFNRYLLKQKSNRTLEANQRELDQKNLFLETLNAAQDKLIKEKEWLIKEVHHRVKNNLQMVTSLLNTQTAYLQDDAAIVAVKDSLRRMQAMSLIHQKLYQEENLSTIGMPDYIDELVRYLRVSFGTGNGIVFEQAIEPLHLDVSQAIPLGLIITESIVNAIKYAFLNGQNGIVRIHLQSDGPDHLLLSISDNGIGLPAGIDIMKHNSLGLDLMKGLTRQLNGNFHIVNDTGVHIKVRFIMLNKQFSVNT